MLKLNDDRQVNAIARLEPFLRHWHASPAQPRPAEVTTVARSVHGNINIGARPFTAPSLLVPRGHQDFYRYIEPGVVDWVSFVVAELGLTTYTSCEGHRYANGDVDERHVGLLVDSDAAAEQVLALHAASTCELEGTACQLGWMDHTVTGDGLTLRALDIFLIRRHGHSQDAYFETLDAAMARVITRARQSAIAATAAEATAAP